MSWQSSSRRSGFEGKQKRFAAETFVADDPSSVDENMDVMLPTDGRSSRVGVLLALLSASTSISAVYLALNWFTGSLVLRVADNSVYISRQCLASTEKLPRDKPSASSERV